MNEELTVLTTINIAMRIQLNQQLQLNAQNQSEVAEDVMRSTTPDVFKSENDVSFFRLFCFVFHLFVFIATLSDEMKHDTHNNKQEHSKCILGSL